MRALTPLAAFLMVFVYQQDSSYASDVSCDNATILTEAFNACFTDAGLEIHGSLILSDIFLFPVEVFCELKPKLLNATTCGLAIESHCLEETKAPPTAESVDIAMNSICQNVEQINNTCRMRAYELVVYCIRGKVIDNVCSILFNTGSCILSTYSSMECGCLTTELYTNAFQGMMMSSEFCRGQSPPVYSCSGPGAGGTTQTPATHGGQGGCGDNGSFRVMALRPYYIALILILVTIIRT